MNYQPLLFTILLLAFGPVMAQSEEVKLDLAQSKITTVSAMRMRKTPQVSAEEVTRLKLGTVVNAIARSVNQDTINNKTDYWYRVNLQNGQSGWLFGGLLRRCSGGHVTGTSVGSAGTLCRADRHHELSHRVVHYRINFVRGDYRVTNAASLLTRRRY